MIVKPQGENMLTLTPSSEIESFYIKNFLKLWAQGNARIIISDAINETESLSKIELYSGQAALPIPSSFFRKPL